MAKSRKKKADMWEQLMEYIRQYRDAAINESWKGGGDPADIPVIDKQLELQEALLENHIEKMRREFE